VIPVSEADRFTTRRGVYMELRSVDLRETGKGHQPLCGDLWGGEGGLEPGTGGGDQTRGRNRMIDGETRTLVGTTAKSIRRGGFRRLPPVLHHGRRTQRWFDVTLESEVEQADALGQTPATQRPATGGMVGPAR